VRKVEDILLSGVEKQGERLCVVWKEKQARAGSRNGTQKSLGFNKKIKKSALLIMGVRGRDLSSPSSYYRF
jgi:hypothetical protein